MNTMLTLFGRDLKELNFKQLERERRCQKYILTAVKQGRYMLQRLVNKRVAKEENGEKKVTSKAIAEDKLTMCDIYITHLEALIREIEYWMSKRAEPLDNRNGSKTRTQIKALNAERRKNVIRENARLYRWQQSIEGDGLLISWDRDKFIHIAEDRGYQTEEMLIYDVGQELKLDRARAEAILQNGRFTWGQVLCLGAMMQMTPKEFCDTFLAGYFIDHGDDEYRADYENVKREELLRRAVKPQQTLPPLERIEVGSDGRPLDEEIWFDE